MGTQSAKKQNITLIIGLSIPVAMILFVAIAINAPHWFSTTEPPQYDFLYTSGQHNSYVSYQVNNGRLQRKDLIIPEGGSKPTEVQQRFFIHTVATNTSKEISEDEALNLQLDGSLRSGDGYKLKSGRRGGWFLFGYGRDYNTRYLVKDNYSLKLELETHDSNQRYYWNIQFLGWINADE